MKKIKNPRILWFAVILFFTAGCMTFTEKDYQLQEKAYQRDREVWEQQHQDRWNFNW